MQADNFAPLAFSACKVTPQAQRQTQLITRCGVVGLAFERRLKCQNSFVGAATMVKDLAPANETVNVARVLLQDFIVKRRGLVHLVEENQELHIVLLDPEISGVLHKEGG